ncbi:MAG TPA: S8 family serine peptidase, partial [Bdellovibrionota bacterium]|nr:S8 family serine peptidase [Bdellovibrionota bacterium]
RKNELIVKVVSPAALADAARVVDIERTDEIDRELPEWKKLTLRKGTDLEGAIKLLERVGGIAHVERNYVYRASIAGDVKTGFDYVPSEKKFREQWALFNFGQKVGGRAARIGADIGILAAWNHRPGVQHAAKDIQVAVIDSGITLDHPDLAPNIWHNPGEAGEKATNGIDDDENGYVDDSQGWDWTSMKVGGDPTSYNGDRFPDDGIGHGTHVAGIIGAAHDGKGVAGINASVRLMALKFLGQDGSGSTEWGASAILYAVRMGADVINASWGGGGDSLLLRQVIRHAQDKGVLFVAAAGNSSLDNDVMASYPANYPDVFSVVSTDAWDEVSIFSSFGRTKTQIAAPGETILSTFKHSLFNRANLSALSGTSMATPQVTGVAAMLMGLYPGKFRRNPEAVKKRIMETSDIQGHLLARTASGGRLNAFHAVTGAITPGHYPEEGIDWTREVEAAIESPHPYTNGAELEWKLSHPGAKWIRLRFGRHSLERVNDYVEVRDRDGQLVDVLTGYGLTAWSRPVRGDGVTLKLVSNGFVTGWGFELTAYEVVE